MATDLADRLTQTDPNSARNIGLEDFVSSLANIVSPSIADNQTIIEGRFNMTAEDLVLFAPMVSQILISPDRAEKISRVRSVLVYWENGTFTDYETVSEIRARLYEFSGIVLPPELGSLAKTTELAEPGLIERITKTDPVRARHIAVNDFISSLYNVTGPEKYHIPNEIEAFYSMTQKDTQEFDVIIKNLTTVHADERLQKMNRINAILTYWFLKNRPGYTTVDEIRSKILVEL
jgi:hypothetical protein